MKWAFQDESEINGTTQESGLPGGISLAGCDSDLGGIAASRSECHRASRECAVRSRRFDRQSRPSRKSQFVGGPSARSRPKPRVAGSERSEEP